MPTVLRSLTLAVAALVCATSLGGQDADRSRAGEALPDKAPAKPLKPRKLLVFSATRGFRHASIPAGARALTALGEKTSAYQATHTEDAAAFEAASLSAFDAVCMLNTTGEPFLPPDFDNLPTPDRDAAQQTAERLKESLRDFVEGGKGLVGIHSATDTFYEWPWYGEAIGGYFDGHPWGADNEVVIRVEDPAHPLCAALEGRPLQFKEEIYQLRAPFSRERCRVLLSLDTSRTDMNKQGIHREDGDFAVSWVRRQGQGRVFYCSLGHNDFLYQDRRVLGHYLAGIQFALGDLEADSTPRPRPASAPAGDGH